MSRFWHRWKIELLIALAGLIAINLIFFARAFRETRTIDRQSAGELGDFVGGYVGTFFTLLGVVLVVRTLRSQVEASEREHFETKYFELLKMHRDNVAEFELPGATGMKVFVLMIRELRCVLDVVRRIATQSNQKLDQRELLTIAYYCLFFGVGPNSSRMLKISLSKFNASFVDAVERELNNERTKSTFQKDRNFNFTPFEGHQSRLGHYYRHLYQMVKYVDQQLIEIDKYEHVKTIRAQLSTHEQALLLINSLTRVGNPWWQNGFIVTYRLVQNIPHDFFDKTTELDTSTLFNPGYFEWEDAESG